MSNKKLIALVVKAVEKVAEKEKLDPETQKLVDEIVAQAKP